MTHNYTEKRIANEVQFFIVDKNRDSLFTYIIIGCYHLAVMKFVQNNFGTVPESRGRDSIGN